MLAKSLVENSAESNNLVQNIAEPIFIDNIVTGWLLLILHSHPVVSVKDKHIAKMYKNHKLAWFLFQNKYLTIQCLHQSYCHDQKLKLHL